jgi:plastocyanin
VQVHSQANQLSSGTALVDVEAYAKLLGVTYTLDSENEKVSINNHKITLQMVNGVATTPVREIADATGGRVTWDAASKTAYVLQLPEGAIQLSPTVPGMGEHWAVMGPQGPQLPIYGVYKGQLAFYEYLMPQQEFIAGKSYIDIPATSVPAPTVKHFDMEFLTEGLPGIEIPLYAFHHYFVTHEEHLMFGLEHVHANHDNHGEGDMKLNLTSISVLNETEVQVGFTKEVAGHTTNLEHKHFNVEHRDAEGKLLHNHNVDKVKLGDDKKSATLTLNPAMTLPAHANATLHLVVSGLVGADGSKLSTEKDFVFYVGAPEVESVTATAEETVVVEFNQPLANHTTNLDHKHFTIEHKDAEGKLLHNHNVTEVTLSEGNKKATLELDPKMALPGHANATLDLVINKVVGLNGAVLESQTVQFTVFGEFVVIDSHVFNKKEITIKKGTTVVWVNLESMPHTVTDMNGTFDSNYMAQGDRWSYTFEEAGEFEYFCLYHPNMVGKVTVVEE